MAYTIIICKVILWSQAFRTLEFQNALRSSHYLQRSTTISRQEQIVNGRMHVHDVTFQFLRIKWMRVSSRYHGNR